MKNVTEKKYFLMSKEEFTKLSARATSRVNDNMLRVAQEKGTDLDPLSSLQTIMLGAIISAEMVKMLFDESEHAYVPSEEKQTEVGQ